MRLLVLSRQRLLHSTRRLHESAVARGHEVRVLDPFDAALAIGAGRPGLTAGGRSVGRWDAAIPRVGTKGAAHAVAVVEQLESMGVATVNRAEAIRRARDKTGALQRLADAGLGVPATVALPGRAGLDAALERVGGPPVVLKLNEGTQGVGVILAESRAAVESILDTLWALDREVLIQAFVAESRGVDVRALVVDGAVVAAIRRTARRGEWRSNLHRGGAAEAIALEPAYETAATRAVAAVGLGVAGVDLLESAEGPLVMEVNPSPGIEGIERATGADVAGAIVRYAEARVEAAPRPGRVNPTRRRSV